MNFDAFHFAEPRGLWLAAVAPLLLVWLHWHAAGAHRRQLARMASPHFVPVLTASHSPERRRFKEWLLVVAVFCAGVALARPQWGHVTREQTFVGEDVVFALDCSLSMTTTDVLPNRLERAKYSILNFVQRQSHGRVGLVTFAGSAFIQCPLTFDTEAFDETLLSIDERSMPIPGTDIGRALEEANSAMDKNARRKLVVLVTDGEDLEKTGIAVAKHLATNGVVVFTIGVGTATGGEIQTVNSAGQQELLRDGNGEIVHSRLDEDTLLKIAEVTGGSYYPLGSLGEGLMRIGPAIRMLDNARGVDSRTNNSVDRYYWFVAVVLGLLVAESLIGTRRKTRVTTA